MRCGEEDFVILLDEGIANLLKGGTTTAANATTTTTSPDCSPRGRGAAGTRLGRRRHSFLDWSRARTHKALSSQRDTAPLPLSPPSVLVSLWERVQGFVIGTERESWLQCCLLWVRGRSAFVFVWLGLLLKCAGRFGGGAPCFLLLLDGGSIATKQLGNSKTLQTRCKVSSSMVRK